MRLTLVPLILAVILAVAPATVQANSNQAAAEKIAASLGDRYPGYDIAVSYQNGKVQLAGQVASRDMMHSAVEHVQRIPGVRVTEIENGLYIKSARQTQMAVMPMQSDLITPPTPERINRAKPAKPQVASAPVPMPKAERSVVQASAQNRVQAPSNIAPGPYGQPLEYAQGQQRVAGHAPMMAPQGQMAVMNGAPMQGMPQQGMMPQQCPPGMMQQGNYCPEPYGPQGPMPGRYNNPNLPEYAWPSYAAYPNYAQVAYPKQYSPKSWPYIGPFYPYPQPPLGWRQVTMKWEDGAWWLDFDDSSPTGPFSPLFRQPIRYTY